MLCMLSRRQLKSDENSSENIKFHQRIPMEYRILSNLFFYFVLDEEFMTLQLTYKR